MELKDILAISGKSGLYKVITHTKTGLIAENLTDQKRIPVYASDKISNLEEISVYTDDKEIALKDVFKAIHDNTNGGKAPDQKTDEKKLREFFAQAVPNHDRQRVYVSDIKKMLNWYNILHDNNMMVFTDESAEQSGSGHQEEKSKPDPEEHKIDVVAAEEKGK